MDGLEDGTHPLACTLSLGDYRNRLTWIAELSAQNLRSYKREDLRQAELGLALSGHCHERLEPRRQRGDQGILG